MPRSKFGLVQFKGKSTKSMSVFSGRSTKVRVPPPPELSSSYFCKFFLFPIMKKCVCLLRGSEGFNPLPSDLIGLTTKKKELSSLTNTGINYCFKSFKVTCLLFQPSLRNDATAARTSRTLFSRRKF